MAHVDGWQWVHQLSSTQYDSGEAVAVDRFGYTYVTGLTEEDLPGAPERHAGVYDVFLAKYDRAGRLQWVHLLGSPEQGEETLGDGLQDVGLAIAVDDVGGVYITGITDGTLPGSTEIGPGAFIAKYSSAGERIWVHELGPQTGPGDSRPRPAAGSGIAVDHDGNVVVTGVTYVSLPGVAESPSGNVDLFIAKYDGGGRRLWIHQLAMPDTDFASGYGGYAWEDWTDVTVDRWGNAFVAATTFPIPPWDGPGADVFIASYDAAGGRRWVRQLGSTGSDRGQGVAIDGVGGVYVTGTTTGTLPTSQESNVGSSDMFIAKYSTTGAPQWVHQFGSPDEDRSYGMAVDRSRNLYLVGATKGLLPGWHGGQAGSFDVAVAKFDRTGAPLWARQIGTRGPDYGMAIALDPSGNPVITGGSDEAPLPGAPEGILDAYHDIFVAKLSARAPTDR